MLQSRTYKVCEGNDHLDPAHARRSDVSEQTHHHTFEAVQRMERGSHALVLPAFGRLCARIVDEKRRDELALTIDDARKAEHGKNAVDDRKVKPAQAGRTGSRTRMLQHRTQQRICTWLHHKQMVSMCVRDSHKIERCAERTDAKGTVVCGPDSDLSDGGRINSMLVHC